MPIPMMPTRNLSDFVFAIRVIGVRYKEVLFVQKRRATKGIVAIALLRANENRAFSFLFEMRAMR